MTVVGRCLIACASVANLLLARAGARLGIAVQLALAPAAPGLRQFLTESMRFRSRAACWASLRVLSAALSPAFTKRAF
jgi:hypothetical protein